MSNSIIIWKVTFCYLCIFLFSFFDSIWGNLNCNPRRIYLYTRCLKNWHFRFHYLKRYSLYWKSHRNISNTSEEIIGFEKLIPNICIFEKLETSISFVSQQLFKIWERWSDQYLFQNMYFYKLHQNIYSTFSIFAINVGKNCCNKLSRIL